MVTGAIRNAACVPLATSFTATDALPTCVQAFSALCNLAVSGGVASWVAPERRLALVSPDGSVGHTVGGTCGSVTVRLSPVAVGGIVAAAAGPASNTPAPIATAT